MFVVQDERISKSEAARRLGRSPAMVTKYIRCGLPAGADGKLSWPQVQWWVMRYVCTEASGNYRTRALGNPLVNAGPAPVSNTSSLAHRSLQRRDEPIKA